uniref:glutathione peroxidase n=1 Tax=Oreochromis niloticus TaxID=8128 RepID=I3K243_ORENI
LHSLLESQRPFDPCQRQLSALNESGDQEFGYRQLEIPSASTVAEPEDEMTFIAKTFYDLRATTLEGDSVDFNVFRGRVVLIENVASELNQLQSKYPHRLVVLGFPCNQFGYQENCTNGEILNSLQHVRPGGGFKPIFTIFEKCDVNGTSTHPVFAYLKDKLPYPDDDPNSLIQDPKFLVWSPISRTDISWNFEKFLIGPEGEPFKRYSKKFPTIDIEPDIQRLAGVGIIMKL